MSKLVILHLSDLHWSHGKATDQQIVIDALHADLKRLASENVVPDIVIFTGDLIQSGDDPSAFDEVIKRFVQPTKDLLNGIPFIIVPGNHDISRKVVREVPFVEQGLKSTLVSVDELNKFIDGISSSSSVALARLDAYESAFVNFPSPVPEVSTPLLKTYKLKINEISVGVSSFNTAWRATGEPDSLDRHFLLLGERNVDVAAASLADCEVRIAAFHHPLEWLSDFDEGAVRSRITTEFDLLMFGHSHNSRPEFRTSPTGSALLSQSGCLYEHRDYFNGYQVITLDLQDSTATFDIRTYFNRPRRAFDRALNIADQGRFVVDIRPRSSQATPEISSFLRQVRPIVRRAAADQVNIVEAVSDLQLDPKEAFICPPLTLHRSSSEAESKLTAEDLLKSADNFKIVGQRETGKSSLAHYLAVLVAEGTCDRPRVPAVVDFRDMKLSDYGLQRAVSTYFGTVKKGLDLDKAMTNGDLIIIVDNFSSRVKSERIELAEIIARYPNCRWIVLSDTKDDIDVSEDEDKNLLTSFRQVHIQTLPRKSIRELSRRWCEVSGLDTGKAFAAVMRQLRDANLPRTGYMVTLLLWAMYQERRLERINESVLLTSIVDHLLGKADFKQALDRAFDPVAKEITLQHIALGLREAGGVMLKNDVLESLLSFFRSKGLRYDAADVLIKLISCGLLNEREGLVSFKYRCFEEYFVATRLRDETDELANVLKDRNYLQYPRELELLSGLRRRNSDVIRAITSEIQDGMPERLRDFDPHQFDEIVASETGGGLTPRRLSDIKKKKLTAEQIDDLLDAADQKVSRRSADSEKPERRSRPRRKVGDAPNEGSGAVGVKPLSPLGYMATISLLGKVLRNSEFNDFEEKAQAARLYTQSAVKMMLLYADMLRTLVDSLQERSHGDDALEADDVTAIKYLVIKWFMLATAENVSNEVGSEKLFLVFEDMLSDEKVSIAEKFLVGMMMLELNHPNWIKYWRTLIDYAGGKRLLLDTLMDSLYGHIHKRALSEVERRRLETAAGLIDREFGLKSAAAKSDRARSIQRAADESARIEQGKE